MKTKTMLAAALLLLFSALVFAQEAPKDKEPKTGPGRGVMGKLNLTEDQRTKMKDFRADMEKKAIAIRAKAQTSRVELRELISAEKFDKAAIEKKINEIAKIEAEQKMNFINHWDQVNQILTPEQKKIWKNNLRSFEGHGKRGMMRPAGMERRGRKDMRGPGRSRGDIPEFSNQDCMLGEMFMPGIDSPELGDLGFEKDYQFADLPEFTPEEFFEFENDMPEPPEIDLPDKTKVPLNQ